MLEQQRMFSLLCLPVFLVASVMTVYGNAQTPVHILKHDDLVSFISLSSNRELLASGCSTHTTKSGSIFIWDMKTGNLIRKLKGFPFSLAGLEFTHEGRYLISGGLGNNIRIYKLSTGKEVGKIENLDHLTGFVLIGRSRKLGIYEGKSFRLWDISDPEKPKQANACKTGHGTTSVYSIDGKIQAVAVNSVGLVELPPTKPSKVEVWQVPSGQFLHRFNLQKNNVLQMTLSTDKKVLGLAYVFGPNNLEVRNVQNGKIVLKASHPYLPSVIAFSPDTKYIAVGSAISGIIYIWNVHKNTLLRKFKAHSGTVQCLEWTMDGKYLVSGSADHTVKIWKWKDLQGNKSGRRRRKG